MSKRRYTEAQMIGGLKQVEARASGRGCGAGTGSVEAHALRLENDMRWDGCEPDPGSKRPAVDRAYDTGADGQHTHDTSPRVGIPLGAMLDRCLSTKTGMTAKAPKVRE